ncbi:MAG: DUF2095 domain-containing protein [Candidatus Lokiarchaeota archaeon]|nr:DUF2095 domain-containing protein [Candidatus Lokiarchaeota archaeon]
MLDEDKEEFKKKFPNLAEEIMNKEQNIPITSIRSKDTRKKIKKRKMQDELRNPDVIAFIRRANNDEEAEEIIDFCLKKGEITEKYANNLKLQLAVYGVRSFGSKKEPGYYEKKYRNLERKKEKESIKKNPDKEIINE